MQRLFFYRDCATHRWPLTIAGSMLVAVLALGTAVPGMAIAGDSPQSQPILCKPDQNDPLVESAECLERFKELVTRGGDMLRLNLENGRTKVYTGDRKACEEGPWEKCVVFRLVAFYPLLQSFLILKSFDECGHYDLVSRRSGGSIELGTVWEWSPNGKYLVAVRDLDMLCVSYNDLDILSATDRPALVLKHHPGQYESWKVTGWDGDERVRLQVFVEDNEGSYLQDVEAVRSGNGWKLVWGRITNAVPREPASSQWPPAAPRSADIPIPGADDR